MSEQKPSIGRIVHYTLSQQDAVEINRRRDDAAANATAHRDRANGAQVHVGNAVTAGDVFPLIITRVWGSDPTAAVNGQLLLDGNDTYWVTSVSAGDGARHFAWPVKTGS